jgi:hypothetical protein
MIQGIEPAIDALRARLITDLNTRIDAINLERADDIVLDHVAPERILPFVPQPSLLVDFPSIGIGHGPDRFEDDTGFEATGVYDLHVLAFVQHSDQRALAILVRRMKLAVTRCVLEGRNFGSGPGIPWGVTYQGGDFGPAMGKSVAQDVTPDSYMTFCAIAIRCKLDEA